MGFKEVESKVTKVKHYVSTTVHDDIVMALAMAVKEAMSQKSTRIYVASGT